MKEMEAQANDYKGQQKESYTYKNLSKVYYLTPGTTLTAYGIHDRKSFLFAELTRMEGIPSEVLSVRDPDFLKKIAEISRVPGHAIDSGYAGYPSWVTIERIQSANLFDLLDTNIFAMLGDHLFFHFMQPRLNKIGSKTIFYSPCETLIDELKYISPYTNTSSFVLDYHPPFPTVDTNYIKKFKDREIDLLIPWSLNPNHADIDFVLAELSNMGDNINEIGKKLIETFKTEYNKPILSAFFDVYSSINGTSFQFNRIKTKEDYIWMDMLDLVDQHIRQWRRYKWLTELANSSLHLNIVVTQDKKKSIFRRQDLSGSNYIKWIGHIPSEQLDRLYGNSKMVLHRNPTYPNMLHERVQIGMQNGCCIITDRIPGLTSRFIDEEHLLFLNNQDGSLIELLQSKKSCLEDIAMNGRYFFAKNYTPEEACKSLLREMDQRLTHG